jgi:hypothetical protein
MVGWRTNERIAQLWDEADRRRLADDAAPRRAGTLSRLSRHLDPRVGRGPDPVVTARA